MNRQDFIKDKANMSQIFKEHRKRRSKVVNLITLFLFGVIPILIVLELVGIVLVAWFIAKWVGII